jgi:hypothetical protein
MPTGSKYCRVDPVLGNHRCLFSQKPILSCTASQKKSRRSIFCVIFSFYEKYKRLWTQKETWTTSAFCFSFWHWYNLLLSKNIVAKKDKIIQLSNDMAKIIMSEFLNPWSRFPLEKLIVPHQFKRFPAIYGTWSFIIVSTRTSRGSKW